MLKKDSKTVDQLQDKNLSSANISEDERDLIIESFCMLLILIQRTGILINGDKEFTKHVCDQMGILAVRLQYQATSELEVH